MTPNQAWLNAKPGKRKKYEESKSRILILIDKKIKKEKLKIMREKLWKKNSLTRKEKIYQRDLALKNV